VVAPRSDGVPRTAKYQAALEGGHDVLVLISEVWGGFSPEAMRFLGELPAQLATGAEVLALVQEDRLVAKSEEAVFRWIQRWWKAGRRPASGLRPSCLR
jgi:hypothetical protein